MPMFDLKDAAGAMLEVNACRKAFPSHYIKINAFDSTQRHGNRRGSRSSSIGPPTSPASAVVRQETAGRSIRYTVESYAVDRPEGSRY